MNGVCGFRQGFVGGCEDEGRGGRREEMGEMCVRMGNERNRGMARAGGSRKKREDGEEGCVSDLGWV